MQEAGSSNCITEDLSPLNISQGRTCVLYHQEASSSISPMNLNDMSLQELDPLILPARI
jgi:hypothetical protein